MAFLGFRETFCTSTGLKGGVESFLRIYCSLGMSQRPQKCNPNKQLNYKDGLDSALIIVLPAREKWRRGESQQTRGSCQLPCSSNRFHEKVDECVCLCWMFTDPNERKVKKNASYILGRKLQWCGSKVKVAWLCSYCTWTLDHKVRKWNERWQNERKEGGGSWFCQLAKSAYNYFKCFYPSEKLKRGLNLVARCSLMDPLPGLDPGGDHSNFLVNDSFFLLLVSCLETISFFCPWEHSSCGPSSTLRTPPAQKCSSS